MHYDSVASGQLLPLLKILNVPAVLTSWLQGEKYYVRSSDSILKDIPKSQFTIEQKMEKRKIKKYFVVQIWSPNVPKTISNKILILKDGMCHSRPSRFFSNKKMFFHLTSPLGTT